MLGKSTTNRTSAMLVTLLVAWFASYSTVTVAEDERKAGDATTASDAAKIARLRGYVRDAKGKPLAVATVRIAIPAADMRFVYPGTEHKQVEATTDEEGRYQLEVPNIAKSTKVSLDAMRPGYGRLVGTLMMGGDPRSVELVPGSIRRLNLTLKPSLYFAGTVVDLNGEPIEGVEVAADLKIGEASFGVERTGTDNKGSFQLFNYHPSAAKPVNGSRGEVAFFHKDYLRHKIKDIYQLKEGERDSIRIVLHKGNRVSGTLVNSAGKPVAGQMVKVVGVTGRKAALTDNAGFFTMQGLDDGELKLTAIDLKNRQKLHLTLKPGNPRDYLKLSMKEIDLPELSARSVLGMQLTDVTPTLKEKLNLWMDHGALVLDPGKDSDRLKIGKLAAGFNFWMVGQTRVQNVRHFVEQILAEAKLQTNATVSIRVVYNFSTLAQDGSNTQYMRLTQDDLKGLKAFLNALEK